MHGSSEPNCPTMGCELEVIRMRIDRGLSYQEKEAVGCGPDKKRDQVLHIATLRFWIKDLESKNKHLE